MFKVDELQKNSRGGLRNQYQTVFGKEESLTIQSDARLADIQEIIKDAGYTGLQGLLQDVDAQFMDVSQFTDYADMMREVRKAEEHFMKLDPQIRARFGQDVFKYLDAAHEERRADGPREVRSREGDPAPVEPVAATTDPEGTGGV